MLICAGWAWVAQYLHTENEMAHARVWQEKQSTVCPNKIIPQPESLDEWKSEGLPFSQVTRKHTTPPERD